MSEDIKKYCYHCGKDIKDACDVGILCSDCAHPVNPKDDKLGFLTYAEDYIVKQAKSKAFSKTYNFAKNFFLSKLASFFLVVSVAVSGVTTVSNVVTTNKNKQYMEEPGSVVESENVNYVEIPAEIYEEPNTQETSTVENNIPVIDNEENTEAVVEQNDIIVEQNDIVEENGGQTRYNVDDDQWNNFMANFISYCTDQEYDSTIFENGEVSGPVSAAFADEDADIGSLVVKDGDHIYAYYYYDDGDWSSSDGDVIFGRLELIDKGDTFAVVSDESSSATFEELLSE
ncbi:MAG: hypothetical protein KBT35_00495 [Firmicutes bacterium]|nr:hypothetical protein [Candidatus Colivicinus equi]